MLSNENEIVKEIAAYLHNLVQMYFQDNKLYRRENIEYNDEHDLLRVSILSICDNEENVFYNKLKWKTFTIIKKIKSY